MSRGQMMLDLVFKKKKRVENSVSFPIIPLENDDGVLGNAEFMIEIPGFELEGVTVDNTKFTEDCSSDNSIADPSYILLKNVDQELNAEEKLIEYEMNSTEKLYINKNDDGVLSNPEFMIEPPDFELEIGTEETTGLLEDYSSDDSIADPSYTLLTNADQDMNAEEEIIKCKKNSAEKQNIDNKNYVYQPQKNNLKKDNNQSDKKLLPICTNKCRKKCYEKLNLMDRKMIFEDHERFTFGERRLFYDKYIIQSNVGCRTSSAACNKRNLTLKYMLPNRISTENPVIVCKTMFLHTLGKNTDSFVTQYLRSKAKKGSVDTFDKRGQAVSEQKKNSAMILEDKVKQFIESYHPVVSHYAIKHAPKRRYLTPDLSIAQLHRDYNNLFATEKIAYETFRHIFKNLNIGFSAPSQDDCPSCNKYSEHMNDIKLQENLNEEVELTKTGPNMNSNFHDPSLCDICVNYLKHKDRYTSARELYQKDSETVWPKNHHIFASDMQKIIIIPKMSIKNAYFVSRLLVMHETFAALHKGNNICVLWHEGITGRNAADVASTYYTVIRNSDPSVTTFTFWCDNCCAQNKNWVLFTTLAIIVNEEWGPEKITFKYFEPGHSFMKADAIQGKIGSKWKQHSNILDLRDLIELINSADSKNSVYLMEAKNFLKFRDGCKARQKNATSVDVIPLLENVRLIEFRKGTTNMFYKTNYNEDFKETSFLKKKFDRKIPETLLENVGVNTEKLNKIKKELLPHIPARKRIFWNELTTNESSRDLCKFSEN